MVIMAEIKITNMVKFFAILLLNEGSKHGYEIIKEIEEKLGKKPSPGQIYPFLIKLEKNHYIKSKKIKGRNKKIYSLTKAGRDFVRKMLNRFGGLIDVAVEPRLSVCAHCGCKVYEGGYKEMIRDKKLAFCCVYCANSFKRM